MCSFKTMLALMSVIALFVAIRIGSFEEPYHKPSPKCDKDAIKEALKFESHLVDIMCCPWRDYPIGLDMTAKSDKHFVESISKGFSPECVKHIDGHTDYYLFESAMDYQIGICKNTLFVVSPEQNNKQYLVRFLYRAKHDRSLEGVTFACMFERIFKLNKHVSFHKMPTD